MATFPTKIEEIWIDGKPLINREDATRPLFTQVSGTVECEFKTTDGRTVEEWFRELQMDHIRNMNYADWHKAAIFDMQVDLVAELMVAMEWADDFEGARNALEEIILWGE